MLFFHPFLQQVKRLQSGVSTHHFQARACKKIRDGVKKYRIPRALCRKKCSKWKLKNFIFLDLHKLRALVINGNHALKADFHWEWVFLLADEKNKRKKTRGKKKKLNVQVSFESANVKICKNQLTNQIKKKAEYFPPASKKTPNGNRPLLALGCSQIFPGSWSLGVAFPWRGREKAPWYFLW